MTDRVTTLSLVTLYLQTRRAEGLAQRTLEQMRSRLQNFATQVPADPTEITRADVVRWMDRPKLAPAYQHGRLSSVRGFALWLAANDYAPRDFTIGIRAPRVAASIPKRLHGDDARRLVEYCMGDTRTLLVVLLMLQEGLRRIEVSRLDVEDVDFAERSILVRGKGGQGQHTGALPLSEETWQALTAHLAEEGHRNGPLIRNRVRTHGRVAPSTISELVRQAMRGAGVKEPGDISKTPHSLRHTAAHDILTATGNVRAVQRALRHASVRSTEVYLRGHVGPDLRDIMAGRSYISR